MLRFTYQLEENLISLQNELTWREYEVGAYRQFYVYEPKRRLVMALPFRDRVVQWSIYQTIHPLIDKRYIGDSYACRVGHGSHASVERLQYWLSSLSHKHQHVYVLKMDVAKYFYRVNHDLLLGLLRRILADEDLLWLLETIVKCEGTKCGFAIDEDGALGEMVTGVGMPIGNLTSQMCANIYLNEIDQFVKHALREKYYMRFMDDSVVVHWDKTRLWEVKAEVERFLAARLGLILNSKTVVTNISQGVDWVGYRVWPDRIKLRKSTALRMRRRLRYLQGLYNMGELDLDTFESSLASYSGMLTHCDSEGLRKALYGSIRLIRPEGKSVD